MDRHDEEHNHKQTVGENGSSLGTSALQMYCANGGADINIGDGADWRAGGRWAGYSICLGLCKFGSCTGQILSVYHPTVPASLEKTRLTKAMTTC